MKLFIIPGYLESITDSQYVGLQNKIKHTKYKPVLISVQWKYKVMSDYVEQVKSFMRQNINDNEKICILGFSFGAYIAFLCAKEFNTHTVLLCSLSPYFKEDLPNIPQAWKNALGKRRIGNFSTYSFNVLAKNYPIPAILFAGSEEIKKYPSLQYRGADAHKRLIQSKFIIVDRAHHDIGQPEYQEAIVQQLQ